MHQAYHSDFNLYMNTLSYRILRFGLGITFVWIGVLVWQSPLAWGSFIQPWALKLMKLPLETTMKITAVFDVAVGLWLMFGMWTRIAAALACAHLAVVLLTTSATFSNVIVRDVGLFAATLSLSLSHPRRRYER